MSLGNIPRAADVALRTTNLDRVIEYEPADLVVTVQAGMRLAEMQRVLGEHGQFLPLDPPLAERSTIGGIIAANASGPLRLRYGACRDQLLGVRVVNANGTITKGGGKVVKNVTGYDMCKLYTGSLGTLGVIVEASFKLAPLPDQENTVLAWFRQLPEAFAAARTIAGSGLPVLACELLSARAADVIQHAAGVAPPADGAFLLAIRVGGGPSAVRRQEEDLLRLCSAASGRMIAEAGHQALWQAIADFGRGAFDSIVKLSVPPSRCGELLAALDPRTSFVSQVLSGVSYVFGADPEPLLPLAQGLQGYTVLEACPLELKRRLDVWGPVGPDFALMERIKRQFDPQGILNPGRYVGRL
jgi:glycolate oxidase FAD binding subunit